MGEVYTWGWKECVPSEKIVRDLVAGGIFQTDSTDQGDFFLVLEKATIIPFNHARVNNEDCNILQLAERLRAHI